MVALTTFAILPAGNQPASLLDGNFTSLVGAVIQPITTTGSANNYTLTPNIPWTVGYVNYKGLAFTVIFHASNTGATSVNVSGLGSVNLYKNVGGTATALATGDIYLNVPYIITCDGANFWLSALTVGSATTGSAGVVQLATTAVVVTGTNANTAVTPAALKGATGTTSTYFKQSIAITSNTTATNAHGLAAAPTRMTAWLRCTTTEGGYSVGDQIFWSSNWAAGASPCCSIAADATNLVVTILNGSNAFGIVNKSTRASFTLTQANWVLDVRLDV